MFVRALLSKYKLQADNWPAGELSAGELSAYPPPQGAKVLSLGPPRLAGGCPRCKMAVIEAAEGCWKASEDFRAVICDLLGAEAEVRAEEFWC